MGKNNKVIFYIAAVTAVSIIVFQTYWVFNTCLAAKDNLYGSAAQALEKSIDAYQISRMSNQLPSSLGDSVPYLSVLQFMQGEGKSASKLDPRSAAAHKTPYQLQFTPFNIDPKNVSEVRKLIASAAATISPQPVKISVIDSLFKRELVKRGITLPFALTLQTTDTSSVKGIIKMPVVSGPVSYWVLAYAPGTWQYVLMKSTAPAGISFILILLTTGSLFFMGAIIRKQSGINRMKTAFVNNITHELRIPVSILKSANEALYQFGESGNREKTRRYLRISAEVLDNLDKNVDRLLDVMRYEDGKMPVTLTKVKPAEIVAKVIESIPPREGQTLTFQSDMTTEQVLTDAYIIETTAFNLIDNALKYSGPGAAIFVKLLRQDGGNGWQLIVSDDGVGIAPAHLSLIFDKFFRVSTGNLHEIKGYGIGLSHVKQLIELLHGTIDVKSKPGKGATFTIHIPFCHE